MRRLSYGFGPVPEDIWLELSSHMVRQLPDGAVTLHYDPAIGEPVRALTAEAAGVALILPGHYATERPALDELAERHLAAGGREGDSRGVLGLRRLSHHVSR